ncbi:hypothetical protein FSP39_022138 [Pinctada imbricata]|uniref:Uncharacterized protein n=1 Tax=Pinctada imbricata TaxID=66713 RepID=A0AA88YNA8_PINIB|nr:hypothetical protein FSP39_019968 [Pinctada imbricata]KAK3109063.1 hypothetical protein FSP39_022138 [Pinctada imbricata]
MEKRRETHKLLQYYKITENLTPNYLKEILPIQHYQQHDHNTRHSQNYINIHCRTSHFFNSFVPSTTRLWNNLPNDTKESESLNSLKHKLNSSINIPRYYFDGTRRGQIYHARLRMKCSSLKHHLFLKNLEPSPYCSCGGIETTSHFLLLCPKYANERSVLNSLEIPVTCDLLLFGDENLDYETNKRIFITVQDFILKTKRFS